MEFRHHYCKVCHRNTYHKIMSHNDGTVVAECVVCKNLEMINRGYNYRRYEKEIKDRAKKISKK